MNLLELLGLLKGGGDPNQPWSEVPPGIIGGGLSDITANPAASPVPSSLALPPSATMPSAGSLPMPKPPVIPGSQPGWRGKLSGILSDTLAGAATPNIAMGGPMDILRSMQAGQEAGAHRGLITYQAERQRNLDTLAQQKAQAEIDLERAHQKAYEEQAARERNAYKTVTTKDGRVFSIGPDGTPQEISAPKSPEETDQATAQRVQRLRTLYPDLTNAEALRLAVENKAPVEKPPVEKETPQEWLAKSEDEKLPPQTRAYYGKLWTKWNEKEGKPEPAAKAKDTFMATVAKVSGEQNLPAAALSNVGALAGAIKNSKVLTPEERNGAIAYLAANTTPAATGSAATIRVEGLGQMREMPVLDTKNNNSPMFLSAADINKANRTEPGRYMPAGVAAPALQKTALIEDIRGNVQQVRDSLNNIPDFGTMDKVKIATALRSRDPKGTLNAMISSGAIGNLSPQQQDYLINVTNLVENAMAMRSVLGAGQGSEDLRSAIMATIPGPTTPSKEYAAKQLDKFEKTLDRLSRGIPMVTLRNEPGAATEAPKRGPGSNAGGMIRVQIPGHPPGQIPASARDQFLKDNPGAKVL